MRGHDALRECMIYGAASGSRTPAGLRLNVDAGEGDDEAPFLHGFVFLERVVFHVLDRAFDVRHAVQVDLPFFSRPASWHDTVVIRELLEGMQVVFYQFASRRTFHQIDHLLDFETVSANHHVDVIWQNRAGPHGVFAFMDRVPDAESDGALVHR